MFRCLGRRRFATLYHDTWRLWGSTVESAVFVDGVPMFQTPALANRLGNGDWNDHDAINGLLGDPAALWSKAGKVRVGVWGEADEPFDLSHIVVDDELFDRSRATWLTQMQLAWAACSPAVDRVMSDLVHRIGHDTVILPRRISRSLWRFDDWSVDAFFEDVPYDDPDAYGRAEVMTGDGVACEIRWQRMRVDDDLTTFWTRVSPED